MIATDGLFQVGISILRTTVDAATRALTAQVGDVLEETVDSDEAELWQQPGLFSRPPQPAAKTRSAQAVALRTAGRFILLAVRDLRGLPSDIGDGETCVYAPGPDGRGQARTVWRGDGRVQIETRTAAGAQPCTVAIDPGGDTITLQNAAGLGLSISPTGVTLTGPGGAQVALTATGAAITSSGITQVDGTLVRLGGAAAVLPGVHGPSGVAGTASTKVLME